MDHPTSGKARSHGIQRVALAAIVTNTLLSVGQIAVGLFAHAFSLVADSAHTLSDLFTDLLVLLAGRRGAEPADRDHPYDHGPKTMRCSRARDLRPCPNAPKSCIALKPCSTGR